MRNTTVHELAAEISAWPVQFGGYVHERRSKPVSSHSGRLMALLRPMSSHALLAQADAATSGSAGMSGNRGYWRA
ncbi:MAG: hypothetical protein ACE3L7_17135 [Candidatus Pristimantibacillus sp.]